MAIWYYWHFVTFAIHGTYDSHLIALPFMFGCGVRVIKSASKCVAFLSLKWRVKGGPRLVDMPGAQWSAALGCHSGITIFITFALLHFVCVCVCVCGGGGGSPPVTGGFPSRGPVTRSFDVFFFFLPAPQQTVKQTMETPVIWDAIALIMMSLQCFLWNWNWFHLLV